MSVRSGKEKDTYSLIGHTMRKHDSLEKDIITGTLPGKRTNIITAWTGLTLNDISRKIEGRNEWRAVIWRAINRRIEED